MKYSPGSFSKNFAWHGTGLRKLHAAIRKGFHNRLSPVDRLSWRRDSGINDPNLELIPVNFFLHNQSGKMSIEELVAYAVSKPHSLDFDRLALFAFHLNRAGSGPRVIERPAMWANEFVRERLWLNDAWQAAALTERIMDDHIQDRVNAAAEVRVKCRTNYRHLFELCEYLPAPLDAVNSGVDQWIGPALFLAWDRSILDGGNPAKSDLLELVRRDELHKLMGTSAEYVHRQADRLVDTYLSAGALSRFSLPTTMPATSAPSPSKTALVPPVLPGGSELPEEGTSEWVDQDESDATVERQSREVQAQVRDRKKAAALKKHYKNTCSFCGTRLQVGSERWYSEAAHVKPLGKPHNGPDRVSNMLVLCPNHHLQFDRGVILLERNGSDFIINSRVPGDPIHGRKLALNHPLDAEFVSYHWKWHSVPRS